MVTKQIPNPRKMSNLVEDRHKKRGFLIRSMHGSIQNQKEAKLPNSHKVTFLIKILYLYISFSCSIYRSLLHDDLDSKTLRKWKEMQPLITIMFWWLINANKRLQNDSLSWWLINAWGGYIFICTLICEGLLFLDVTIPQTPPLILQLTHFNHVFNLQLILHH